MNVLYRRFTLVASLIAALGVMTSILLQETRQEAKILPELMQHQKLMKLTCTGEKSCRAGHHANQISSINYTV